MRAAAGSAGAPDPASALSALLQWHIEFALAEPALITVHERELDNVPEPERREIRRLQRGYAEEWVRVLRRLHPAVTEERARAATHAIFGLLNSTPRSAAGLGRRPWPGCSTAWRVPGSAPPSGSDLRPRERPPPEGRAYLADAPAGR